jgi:DNA-binding transcriptional regulator LsrR (DeoR family)
VVGETCAQFFDIKGRPVDVWNLTRTIAVPLEDLVKMPNVLAVGAGADKARAFLGACRMGIVKSLIVSEDLANEMQRLDALE